MTTKDWNKVHKSGKQYASVSEILLDKVLALYPKGDVLDVGCGSGELTRQLHKRGYNVVGVDISPEGIKKAKQAESDVDYVCTDFMAFSVGKFDIIFINLVLAFAEDKAAFLDHARSMLKPGGQIVLITPVLLDRYMSMYQPYLKEISVPLTELKKLIPIGWVEHNSSYFADFGVIKTLVLM